MRTELWPNVCGHLVCLQNIRFQNHVQYYGVDFAAITALNLAIIGQMPLGIYAHSVTRALVRSGTR